MKIIIGLALVLVMGGTCWAETKAEKKLRTDQQELVTLQLKFWREFTNRIEKIGENLNKIANPEVKPVAPEVKPLEISNFKPLEIPKTEETDISLDSQNPLYKSYFTSVKHQIERFWMYPSEAAQMGISGTLTLRFRIYRDGTLLSARVVDKSGHKILDFAAIKAVKEAGTFDPFPDDIEKEKLSILATFVYSPNYGLLKSKPESGE